MNCTKLPAYFSEWVNRSVDSHSDWNEFHMILERAGAIDCSAPGCCRTNYSHPVNFYKGARLCQAHYLQKKKKTYRNSDGNGAFHQIRESGKTGVKYNKSPKEKNFECSFCGKKYASPSGLHYHQTFFTLKKGESECNRRFRESKELKKKNLSCVVCA